MFTQHLEKIYATKQTSDVFLTSLPPSVEFLTLFLLKELSFLTLACDQGATATWTSSHVRKLIKEFAFYQGPNVTVSQALRIENCSSLRAIHSVVPLRLSEDLSELIAQIAHDYADLIGLCQMTSPPNTSSNSSSSSSNNIDPQILKTIHKISGNEI
jgi:hypothetical protein